MDIISMDQGRTILSLYAADCKFLAEVLEEGVRECGLGESWDENRTLLLETTMTMFRALAVSSVVGTYLRQDSIEELVKEGYFTKGIIMQMAEVGKDMKKEVKPKTCKVTDIESGGFDNVKEIEREN